MIQILYLIILLSLQQVPDSWIPYQPDDQTYRIMAPGSPAHAEKLIETETGDYLIFSDFWLSHVDSSGNFLYMVNYHRIEPALYSADSIQLNYELLNVLTDDLIADQEGSLIYSNTGFTGPFPSLEYRFTYSQYLHQVKGKWVLTPEYLFNIQAYTEKPHSLNRQMDHFIHSFYPVSSALHEEK